MPLCERCNERKAAAKVTLGTTVLKLCRPCVEREQQKQAAGGQCERCHNGKPVAKVRVGEQQLKLCQSCVDQERAAHAQMSKFNSERPARRATPPTDPRAHSPAASQRLPSPALSASPPRSPADVAREKALKKVSVLSACSASTRVACVVCAGDISLLLCRVVSVGCSGAQSGNKARIAMHCVDFQRLRID